MMPESQTMITIDFWNTLVQAETGGSDRREVRLRALRRVARKYQQTLPPEKIDEAKRKASKEFDKIWLNEHRTPTTSELVDNILAHLELPATKAERASLVEEFEESLWEGPPRLADNAGEVIAELAKRYPVGLISDTMYSPGRVLRKYLENHGLINYFSGFVFSDETGYSKPHPDAFRQLLDKSGSRAEHSWHVGDLVKTDIRGAKGLGMKAILFTGYSDGTYTYNEEDDMDAEKKAEPDHVCRNWNEVADILL
ncbi:HAD family hydrolase [Halalkalibaculum sp. DA3122]|uniref:HAD family hydrolase n=1 Tax=Halalkalibaculum sp. DA3122 TaxID=3373607 RepID=UPI0037547E45